MKNIVLFDMDGTLTEPRKEIGDKMIESLKRLSVLARIGIVTGSSYEYLTEQCEKLWKYVSPKSITLLPCNGTQVYEWSDKAERFEKVHSVNMIQELGKVSYSDILQSCLKYQLSIVELYSLPFTGTFLHYRDSMLNWCPIGRNARDLERNAWIDLDRKEKVRERFRNHLLQDMGVKDISVEVTLGGSTSFDIYPIGWDKTYSLRHFKELNHWFVGDNCFGTGNDRKIYEHLLASKRAYSTSGPEQTLSIIDTIKSQLL